MDSLKKQAYADILGKAISDYPTVKMGDALGTLFAAKKEMDYVKEDGYDNYAHRLAMCLNAQKGLDSAAYSLALGVGKELKDIACKTTGLCDRKTTFLDALKDSKKDMKNNIEGIVYGLTNPDKSCRIWLKDLNYGDNTWR